MSLDRETLARLRVLVPDDDPPPVRVEPAPVKELGLVARVTAIGSGRVQRSHPANIFRVLGRHPRLFRSWLRYSARLMPFGTLPRKDAELVILRVAWRTKAAYEWNQHVRLGARAGLQAEEIERAATEDLTGWTPRQETLVRATDELLESSRMTDATWTAVERELDTRGAIELCMLVGQYQGLATALGGLGVQVETERS